MYHKIPSWKMPLKFIRKIAQLGQSISSRLANLDHSSMDQSTTAHDVLKSHRISNYINKGDYVLDVGCGDGKRLQQISIFKEIKPYGIDLLEESGKPQSTPFQSIYSTLNLTSYNGKDIPFPNDFFNVSMICYVLHHLSKELNSRIVSEAIRCSKDRIIVLEDSMPLWNAWYKARNFFHIVDTDIEYSSKSNFAEKITTDGFKTRSEWIEFFSSQNHVSSVVYVDLSDISKYRHHSMFVIELKKHEIP